MLLESNEIGKLGEIATLLEVSAYPKPGNVHRTQDFEDMKYEDFLISSVCIGQPLRNVTEKTFHYYPNLIDQINVGEDILGCVEHTNRLVKTNTNLGIALLLIPLAASVATITSDESINVLPGKLDLILKYSQPDDAIAFVKAIVLSNAGGMDKKTDKYDVNNDNTINDIIQNNINLFNLLEMSSKYDKLSYELTHKLPVLTKIGFSTYTDLTNQYTKNDATLELYLRILSTTPDTLISRKYGEKIAKNVSDKAKSILKDTDIATEERKDSLIEFDNYLRSNKYNPGTTADFTAASIFISLIQYYSTKNL